MSNTLETLNITNPFLQKAWEKSQFKEPTKIQTDAIPEILDGGDVIAESPTGTGKTLAYLLPILEKIDPNQKDPQALIMASSRELVMQIFEEVQKWAEGSGISGASMIGGANVKRQIEKLKKKHPQIIIGTPGRVEELIKTKKLKMHEVKTIVLDEGDQLLVPEHNKTIQSIIKSTLSERQVLLFSATLPPKTEEVGRSFMKDPQVLKVNRTPQKNGKVDHVYVVCDRRDKVKNLEKLSRLKNMKGLAFGKDIGELSVMTEKLEYNRIPVDVLHSEMKKIERQNALQQFRDGKSNLLLATDVAARGLDIKGLTHVIQVDTAEDEDQYLHRAGRTGRAGASGTIVSLVTPGEEKVLKRIVNKLDLTLEKKTFYAGELVDEK
ncbi:DEAD/DEAH box helicase [Pseudalkalibacillus berkeleyi]|uniref:DEAD/DEAH box helicase n=1 Tax=Pseudalkalibacillus berkeleyi TaxID=1069813 RepID=A0ABS9H570_9BACL|nr:DEAD/DEAH box helicase [Pseudalkalibacillus berkeleyi]MCF6139226.1 DEAD/DEAH box helicase [Pseudalkalibacillus berkeleyi]